MTRGSLLGLARLAARVDASRVADGSDPILAELRDVFSESPFCLEELLAQCEGAALAIVRGGSRVWIPLVRVDHAAVLVGFLGWTAPTQSNTAPGLRRVLEGEVINTVFDVAEDRTLGGTWRTSRLRPSESVQKKPGEHWLQADGRPHALTGASKNRAVVLAVGWLLGAGVPAIHHAGRIARQGRDGAMDTDPHRRALGALLRIPGALAPKALEAHLTALDAGGVLDFLEAAHQAGDESAVRIAQDVAIQRVGDDAKEIIPVLDALSRRNSFMEEALATSAATAMQAFVGTAALGLPLALAAQHWQALGLAPQMQDAARAALARLPDPNAGADVGDAYARLRSLLWRGHF